MFKEYSTNKRYLNQYTLTVISILIIINSVLGFLFTPDLMVLVFFVPVLFILSIPEIKLIFAVWFYAIFVCVL